MKNLFLLAVLLAFVFSSCVKEDVEIVTQSSSYDTFNFPDGTQLRLDFEIDNKLITNANYNEFLKKCEELSKDGELTVVYNGKNLPYDIEYANKKEDESTSKIAAIVSEGKVTLYDNDNYTTTGNKYSTFWLTSSVNSYAKNLSSVYRTYSNNVGSGGTVNLQNKVSSIKLEGYSQVVLTTFIPCIQSVVIKNHSGISIINPLASKKFVKLKDIRFFCAGWPIFPWLTFDNRAATVIVSYD